MTWLTIKTLCIIISNVLSFFAAVSITSYYLDGYKISDNKVIRIIQRLTPLIIILLVILNIYIELYLENNNYMYLLDDDKISSNINTMNNDSNNNSDKMYSLGMEVSTNENTIDKIIDLGHKTSQNIALGTVIATTSGAISNTLKSAPIPPLQKVSGIVIASSALGLAYSSLSYSFSNLNKSNLNKSNLIYKHENISNENIVNNMDSFQGPGINKLISNNNNEIDEILNQSPLSHIIWCEKWIAFCCLYLIFQIVLIILSRYYINKINLLKLDFSKYIDDSFNKMIIHYIKKIIIMNSKIGNLYLIFIIFILIFSILTIFILNTILYNNIDNFIELHIIHNRR